MAAGRLQVLEESISERRRVGLLGPGDHIGDWALLTGEPRTATVAALRDSVLVRIDRAAFERFVATSAHTAMRLATRAVERHRPSAKKRREEQEPVRVVALLSPCAHPDFAAVCARLEQALSEHGEVAVLRSQSPEEAASLRETGRRLGRTLDALEERARFVLGVCDPEASSWTRALLRQADAVVVVGLGDDPGRLLADGAMLRAVPADLLREKIAGLRVLAIDARPRTPAEIVVPEQAAAVRLLDLLRLSLGGHEGGLRQVHDALLRSATLAASGHARATLRQEAALLLQIDVGEVGTLQRGHRKALIRPGVDAVRQRADALRNVLRPRPRRR